MHSLDMVVWSGEATFKLNGTLNQHNCMYWSSEYSCGQCSESTKTQALCDVLPVGIVELHIFEGLVTGAEHLSMFEVSIKPFISCMAMRKLAINMMWHPHIHSDVGAYLHDNFPQ
jgi:hypothetical protein